MKINKWKFITWTSLCQLPVYHLFISTAKIIKTSRFYQHMKIHNSNEKLMKCWDKQNWQKIFGSESQYQVEIGHKISQLSECMTSAVKTYIQSRNFPIKHHYLLKVLKVLMYEKRYSVRSIPLKVVTQNNIAVICRNIYFYFILILSILCTCV